MFLREQIIRKKGKKYTYHRIVKVYWDKIKKKIRHKIIMNLGTLKEEEKIIIKNLLSLKDLKDAFITTWRDIKIRKSLEYLSPIILHKIFNLFKFADFIDHQIKENKEIKTSSIFEIITIFRCIKPSSDLKVSTFCKKTILPYLLNIPVSKINPTRIYRTLDVLIKCEDKIQIHIYNQIKELNLDDFNLVYYDITSAYIVGKGECSLILYGLSRDKRRGKKQVLLALAVTKRGYPFYWEVLPGNTVDKKTVKDIVNNLKKRFGIKSCCIVLDRGMITDENLNEIENANFSFIVTLPKSEIYNLENLSYDLLKAINSKNIDSMLQKFKFYNERAYYIELPKRDNRRYVLCFNPEKFLQERKDREDKIEDIKKYFESKNLELSKFKRKRDKEKIEKEIHYYLKKRGATKYFKDVKVEEKEEKIYLINYKLNKKQIEKEKILDGVYVICSNLQNDEEGKEINDVELISSYRGRIKIERTFLDTKQLLELRPIYHKKEFRIKAHILICSIAHLLNVALEYKVRDKDKLDIPHSMINEILEGLRINEVEIKNIKEKRLKLGDVDYEQMKIIKKLGYEDILNEDELLLKGLK
jgi:transposase